MTDLVYIEKYTGAYGDGSNIVLISPLVAEDLAIEEYDNELNELSDSEIHSVAERATASGAGLSISSLRDRLIDIRDEKGDWRGNLDALVDFLS